MSEYTGRHRAIEKAGTVIHGVVTKSWTRRVLVPFSVAGLIICGIASGAYAITDHKDRGDTPTTNLALSRDSGDRASRSDPRITPPAEVKTATRKKLPPKKEWAHPLPGHTSWCNYWQWRDSDSGGYNHRGEDIAADEGTPIHAVHAGNVKIQWDGGGGGNMTIITHDGMAEVYMHQSKYKVKSGHVEAGDIIGYVGSTGDSTGPHLHLEIQPDGPWNGVTSPDEWLAARGVYIGC